MADIRISVRRAFKISLAAGAVAVLFVVLTSQNAEAAVPNPVTAVLAAPLNLLSGATDSVTATFNPEPAGEIWDGTDSTDTLYAFPQNIKIGPPTINWKVTSVTGCTLAREVSATYTAAGTALVPGNGSVGCFVPGGHFSSPIIVHYTAPVGSTASTSQSIMVLQSDGDGTGTPTVVTRTDVVSRTASIATDRLAGTPFAGYVGVGYSYGFTAANGGGCTLSAGSLPPGVTLSTASCVLSGTPTTSGTYGFTLKDALGASVDTVSLLINPAPADPTKIGYNQVVAVNRPYASYALPDSPAGCAVSPGSSLPPGLTLNQTSCIVSGTPTVAGSYTYTLGQFTISIGGVQPPLITETQLVLPAPVDATLSGTPTDGNVNTSYIYQFAHSGGFHCSTDLSLLPPGLSLDTFECELIGTPTTAGTYSYTLTETASDPNGFAATLAVSQVIADALPLDGDPLPAPVLDPAIAGLILVVGLVCFAADRARRRHRTK